MAIEYRVRVLSLDKKETLNNSSIEVYKFDTSNSQETTFGIYNIKWCDENEGSILAELKTLVKTDIAKLTASQTKIDTVQNIFATFNTELGK